MMNQFINNNNSDNRPPTKKHRNEKTTFCRGCDGACPFIRTSIKIVIKLLSNREIMILRYLSSCASYQDYVASIRKGIEYPYMSVKRSLADLQSIDLVTRIEGRGNLHNYYRLTSVGMEYTKFKQTEVGVMDEGRLTPRGGSPSVYYR